MVEWITTNEAAKLSGYSLYHLRELLMMGRIRGQKFGREWQVDKKSLLKYLQEIQRIGEKRGRKKGLDAK